MDSGFNSKFVFGYRWQIAKTGKAATLEMIKSILSS